MALLIEKNIEILGGINIPSIYIRIGYKVKANGIQVLSNIIPYISKESYIDGIENHFLIPRLKEGRIFTYNRDIDGEDVLMFVHDKWKEFLSTDVTEEKEIRDPSTGEYLIDPSTDEYLRDPSTGEYLIDPSTGEYLRDPFIREFLTETVITKPKFADASEITIVDIDSSIS